MESLRIDKVTAGDIVQLQKISCDTFIETFSEMNSAENMKHYLENSFSITQLTDEVSNVSSQFYFAVVDGEIVGYLKLNTGAAQTELKDAHALEIERIYVLKAYHGKKVGQALYAQAIKVARNMAADYIWLGVWEKNFKAISFYTKNGFEAFNQHSFWLGDDEQIDIMMKKILPVEHI